MFRPVFRVPALLRAAAVVVRSGVFSPAPGPARAPAAALRAALCAAWLAGALAACSPAYDWRAIVNNADGYSIDLPAKPTVDERPIQVAGTSMTMKMQAAHTEGAVFAIGTVMLPSDDPQVQRDVLNYLQTGLARNLGAAPEARATQVPLATGGVVLGIEMDMSGSAGAQREHKTIHVRLVARGRHVYQATIIADRELPQEQIDQFFQSFKLY